MELFGFSMNPWELVLRGSAVYWFLFLLFRFVLRRDAGSLGIADLLFVVIIADASQNAMAGEYRTVADGFVLISTLAAWTWLMDWAGFHSPRLQRFFEATPTVLVRHGRLQHRGLRKELISPAELMGRLREHGVEKLDEVKFARLETSGDITVVKNRRDA